MIIKNIYKHFVELDGKNYNYPWAGNFRGNQWVVVLQIPSANIRSLE